MSNTKQLLWLVDIFNAALEINTVIQLKPPPKLNNQSESIPSYYYSIKDKTGYIILTSNYLNRFNGICKYNIKMDEYHVYKTYNSNIKPSFRHIHIIDHKTNTLYIFDSKFSSSLLCSINLENNNDKNEWKTYSTNEYDFLNTLNDQSIFFINNELHLIGGRNFRHQVYRINAHNNCLIQIDANIGSSNPPIFIYLPLINKFAAIDATSIRYGNTHESINQYDHSKPINFSATDFYSKTFLLFDFIICSMQHRFLVEFGTLIMIDFFDTKYNKLYKQNIQTNIKHKLHYKDNHIINTKDNYIHLLNYFIEHDTPIYHYKISLFDILPKELFTFYQNKVNHKLIYGYCRSFSINNTINISSDICDVIMPYFTVLSY